MANTLLDKLLSADVSKIELPTSKIEIKRLSKLFGFKFELTLRAIPAEQHASIQKNSFSIKKNQVHDIDIYQMQIQTILAGVVDPSFKDKNLLEKFGVATPKDLVGKLFLSAELSEISNEINKLCGFDAITQEELEDEVKNA